MLLADAPLDLRTTLILLNAVAGVFLLGVGVAAVRDRRRRAAAAPNKVTYHGDDVLEGARLERIQLWALAMLGLFVLSFAAYWIFEPERQEAMGDQFLETSIEQGAALFAANDPETNPAGLGCANCHGPEAEGGAATPKPIIPIPKAELELAEGALDSQERVCAPSPDDDTQLICQLTWKAPALNTVMLRFAREEVHDIIVFGRPGTPMPAWGLEGGGPKNEQSIENLLDYIESIQIDPDEAKAEQAEATDGRLLFQQNCARCHTKHWSYLDGTFATSAEFDVLAVPGGGAFGPNLTGGAPVRQFPDAQDHADFIATGSDRETAYGTRGIGSGRMPGFARMLSEAQIRAIVEYERSLTPDRVKLDDLVATTPTATTTTTTTAPAGGAGEAEEGGSA